MKTDKEDFARIIQDIHTLIIHIQRNMHLVEAENYKVVSADVRIKLKEVIEEEEEEEEIEIIEIPLLPRQFLKWFTQYHKNMIHKLYRMSDKLTSMLLKAKRDPTDPNTWVVGDVVRSKDSKKILGLILDIEKENWPAKGIYVNAGNIIPDEYGVDELELVSENES